MARRSFAPALRSLLTETKAVQAGPAVPHPLGEGVDRALERRDLSAGAEEKTISVIGGAYTSSTYAGHNYGGMYDRAAGYDLESVVIDGYEQVVWVYKSINYIGGHFARLPFVIGKNRGTDDEEVLDDHPLYKVLNGQANPLETGFVFRKRLSAHVLLSKKGAFVEVTKSRAGTIVRLDLLAPDRVLPVPDPDGNYLLRFDYTERSGYVRPIAPQKIRWVRDPHPFDPFCGNTPIDPTGSSIELDRLYRAYQTSFIKNDARPGGIVGVDADTLTDSEMARVESRFQPGAHNAGMMSVIATGPGGLRYVDTTTRPRDMAYQEGMQAAKETILAGFGLGESLFGNASGRTFDNAEQEQFNAWSETLLPHFDLATSAFAADVEGDWAPWIDTSSVAILDLPMRKKREEWRAEVEAGLRSVNEYRKPAGLPELDNAYARALWISPSKAPIPARPEDAEALGLTGPGTPGGEVPPGAEEPDLPPDATAADAVAAARDAAGGVGIPTDPSAAGAVAQARGLDPSAATDDGTAAGAVDAARAVAEGAGPGEAAAAVGEARAPQVPGIEGKALEQGPGGGTFAYEPTDAEAVQAELAIAAALDAMLARQQGVIVARLESPKTRKGTRYWTPDSAADVRAGQQPIDAAKVVDAQRWVDETTDTMRPLVEQYGTTAAAGLLAAFAGAGLLASAPSPAEDVGEFVPEAAQASVGTMLGMLVVAADAMLEWLRDVEQRITVDQMTAETIDDLVVTVKSLYTERARDFTESLAISLSQGTVNGARDAAAAAMTPVSTGSFGDRTVGIVREWVSQRDDRVRPSHKAADGERLPVGQPFVVGGYQLRYPNDPLGPPQETRGCRCRAHYSSVKSGRFIVPPVE